MLFVFFAAERLKHEKYAVKPLGHTEIYEFILRLHVKLNRFAGQLFIFARAAEQHGRNELFLRRVHWHQDGRFRHGPHHVHMRFPQEFSTQVQVFVL